MSNTCFVIMGDKGSGKSTLTRVISDNIERLEYGTACKVNLDPGIMWVPYQISIDVRDNCTSESSDLINIKKTFDQLLDTIETHSSQYIIINTNTDQTDLFTDDYIYSILTTKFNTLILYVLDITECLNPITFYNKLLQASSILYEHQLPFLVVLNKIDLVHPTNNRTNIWINDLEELVEDIEQSGGQIPSDLTIEDFYEELPNASISALFYHGINNIIYFANSLF